MEKIVLKNGITVVLEYLPYYASASLGVWIRTGSAYETPENNGMAHAIEHMVFKGTASRTARELADAMTEIGDNIDAFTTKVFTCFHARVLSEHLNKAIDIFADMLTNSLFEEEALRKELGVICEEIDMYNDSPEDIVQEQLEKKIWRDHPLGYQISGDKERVSLFTRDELLAFKEKYYVGNRMVIALAGKYDREHIVSVLEDAFGGIETGDEQTDILSVPEYVPSFYSKRMEIEQIHVAVAYDQIDYYDPDKMILSLINCILGGNSNSRLYVKLREELGIAYSICSYDEIYDRAGVLYIYAAVHKEQLLAVIRAAYDIVEDIRKNGVTQHELYIVKQQIKTGLIIGQESTYNQMSRLGKATLLHGKIKSREEILEEIEAITSDDIVRYMNAHFIPENISLSLVGDLDDETERNAGILLENLRKGITE